MPRSNQFSYTYLFDNQEVKRWYDNLARGSEITADVYLRRVGAFCKKHNLSPSELALIETKHLEQLIMDHVTDVERRFTGGYVKCTLKAVKSWLAYNDVQISKKIRIRRADDAQSRQVIEERVPTKEELRRVLNCATTQSRVAVALMAYSGLRPESLGNYKGTDGIRLGDLPELEIGKQDIKFKITPAILVVRSDLSKTRRQYFSFVGSEACEYLLTYLRQRIRAGEILSLSSPVLRPANLRRKPFLRTTIVGRRIRTAIRRADFRWRPYLLRCYFASGLELSESKGQTVRDFRVFWMGHSTGIEGRYSIGKKCLPDSVIQEMREAYKRSLQFLQTTTEDPSREDLRLEFKKQLLAVAGFSEADIRKLDIPNISDEKLHGLIRQRLLGFTDENGNGQRVVSLDEVEYYVQQGWQYVDDLPHERAIIRIPRT